VVAPRGCPTRGCPRGCPSRGCPPWLPHPWLPQWRRVGTGARPLQNHDFPENETALLR